MKVCALEVPPPGVGLVTVMLYVPAVIRSDAGIEAVSLIEELYVVVLGEPAKFTTEVGTKFVPFTVRLNVELPEVLVVGEMEVVVGTGLLTVTTGEAAMSVKVPLSDVRDWAVNVSMVPEAGAVAPLVPPPEP